MPLVDYALNYNYIVEELCEEKDNSENSCLGKCHLSKEIQKQNDIPADKPLIVKFDFLKNPHTFNLIYSQINNNKDKFILDKLKSEKELFTFLKPQTPPPKYI